MRSLFLDSYYCLSCSNPDPQKNCIQYEIRRCRVFFTCWCSCKNNLIFFLFATVLMLDSFILRWWAAVAADLNMWYISSNSTSWNVTFLCFLEVLPASLVLLLMGPVVLFKVYSIALNTLKNIQSSPEISFCCFRQFTGEMSYSHGDD